MKTLTLYKTIVEASQYMFTHYKSISTTNAIFAEKCLCPKRVMEKDLGTGLLHSQSLSFNAYKM